MQNKSYCIDQLKSDFKKAYNSRSEYVDISKRLFEKNHDAQQNFTNLCSVEKKTLSLWLSYGKSYEESADPKNSIAVLIALFVFVLTSMVNFMSTVLPAVWQFIIILLSFVVVCCLIGNLINIKMKIVQLNIIIESAIKYQQD